MASQRLRSTLAAALALAFLPALGPCVENTPRIEREPTEPPTQAPPTLELSELQPWAEGSPEARAASHLKRGLDAYGRGDFEGSLTELATSAGITPLASNLVAWTRGNALLRLDRPAEAEAAWAAIPEDSRLGPQARLARIDLALDDDDGVTALSLLEPFAEVDSGGPEHRTQLRAELRRSRALRLRNEGGDLTLAYQACARAWAHSGIVASVSMEAQVCLDSLQGKVASLDHKGLHELAIRARSVGRAHSNKKVIQMLGEEEAALKKIRESDSETACRGLLELGRAWHKERKYSKSVPRLRWAADNCPEGDEKIRAHYLLAQSLQRGGKSDQAIKAWRATTEAWPDHRFADDGLFHSAEIDLRRGRLDKAKATFTEMADRFPEGDMVPAGTWGMAWAHIEAGQPEQALEWLERQASAEARGPQHERVLQARYWIARIHLDQAAAAGDEAARSSALDELASIAKDGPFNWYGLLAFWRLEQADRGRAEEVAQEVRVLLDGIRSGPEAPERFAYEREFHERPGLQEGIELLRSGLHERAVTELRFALGSKAWNRWNPDTCLLGAWLLTQAGAPNHGHQLLRRSFKNGWPGLEAADRPWWVTAYPSTFQPEIYEAARAYRWSHRLFQGLVREESAFSPQVKSWAGAMGLSQLMWATARETARKMGIGPISRARLSDPALNLKIGTYYLNSVLKRWSGHVALALGSYNAGSGAVGRWVTARGDRPLDSFVETIPFKQTRLYTKHVYASYQTYSALYGEGPSPFVALRVGVISDAIAAGDPKLPEPTAASSP